MNFFEIVFQIFFHGLNRILKDGMVCIVYTDLAAATEKILKYFLFSLKHTG